MSERLPTAPTDTAFKVMDTTAWAAFQSSGTFAGSPVDLADGYIHLSTADQLVETLGKHYAGQSDLICLSVDLTGVSDILVWEPSRGGALFPHLYGPLDHRWITASRPVSVTAQGGVVWLDLA